MNSNKTIDIAQKLSQRAAGAGRETAITIKGAREHNLKNVDVSIPKNKLVVVTGVSGSGKSSLIMDTLYAEGQRRYVESLSSYARQFLMRMNKPEVDYIKGICPAIAIEQKVITRTSRSTVGSLTEIYDYLKLLFARVGKTYSPVSGELVKKHEVSDVVDFIFRQPEGTKIQLLVPMIQHKTSRTIKDELKILLQKGFTRVAVNGELQKIEELLEEPLKNVKVGDIQILIDRIVVKQDEEDKKRVADSVQTAFFESEGECIVEIIGQEMYNFSNRFEMDGIRFEEPTPHLFSYNNPYGACKRCEGFGHVIGIDEDLVIPDKTLSVYEGAVACWKGEKMGEWRKKFVKKAPYFDFPIHRAIEHLSAEEYDFLWKGNREVKGINAFFSHLEEKTYKIQYRVLISRYRGRTRCPECKGTRLRKDASYVKIDGKSITDIVLTPINHLVDFFKKIILSEHDQRVAKRILIEINNRIHFMLDVGLGYLTLNRLSNTLSGGETQRINLTRTLGSNLTSSLYILDEPSIGLHSRDTDRLIKVLKRLRDLGNTVVVVEHDEDIMKAADHIIDMGPLAGIHGGEVTATGTYGELVNNPKSLTGAYLSGRIEIPVPKHRRKPSNFIHIKGARHHNLKNIDVKFPLQNLTVVTGVSGSGKTTLVKQILYPALMQKIMHHGEKPGAFSELGGDLSMVSYLELIDQNPIGKSSRSNPVTYVKAYDAIRDLFSKQQLSKIRGYQPKYFSFNVDGGRCDTCKGEGETIVEMQFLADIHLVCEDCGGKRFKPEVLEVTYKDKNIYEVLDMSVDEAIEFFSKNKDIRNKLQPLSDVGLGYIRLGQSSSTLSGGEAQRVKLASFLGKGASENKILFLFDEPTTGLHFNDIKKLLDAFNALIEQGHSIIVIEHNMDVIKAADWIIDLGPDGGETGGNLVFAGAPEELVKIPESYTAQYLKQKL